MELDSEEEQNSQVTPKQNSIKTEPEANAEQNIESTIVIESTDNCQMESQREMPERSKRPEADTQPRRGMRIRTRTDFFDHNIMVAQITSPRSGDEGELTV